MPTWISRLLLRVRATLSPTPDRDLRDEHDFHLQLLEEEYRAQGMSAADARDRARREFGNATRLQEASHDLLVFRALEDLAADTRYAFRQMRRSPGFTAIAVLSLAVGIGAVTSAFTLLDAFMLRRLPVVEPHRLVAFSLSNSAAWSRWPYAYYAHWREAADAPADVTAVYGVSPLIVPDATTGADALPVRVGIVSGNYFDVLGVPIPRGRPFTAADDRVPGGHPIAVISDGFWDRRYGRADDVLGRTIALNHTPYTIIGIAAPGFIGDAIAQPADVWVPLAMQPALSNDAPALLSDRWGQDGRWLRVIGRLHQGVTPEEAAARANALFQQFVTAKAAELGDNSPAIRRERAQTISLLSAATGYAPQRERYARPVVILGVIVALVMLVACANFANLLLARSRAQHREFVVRIALGAGRWRIIRQSMTECAVLAFAAGGLALLVANWAAAAALSRFATMVQPVDVVLRMDARVLTFALACVAIVMVFGTMASMWGARVPVTVPALQRVAPGTRGWRRTFGAGRLLLVTQLALCTVMLIGAALLVRTVVNLRTQDIGWNRNVLLVSLAPRQAGDNRQLRGTIMGEVRERLAALPGIESVSASDALLFNSANYWVDVSERLLIDGAAPVPGGQWTFAAVGPGFFSTMGLPIVRGREFTETDLRPPAEIVIINQSLARLLFGDGDPVGRRLGMNLKTADLQIIGVVNDAKQISPRERGLGMLYRPLADSTTTASPSEILSPAVTLAVKTKGESGEAADMIQHQIASIDTDLKLSVRTVSELVDEAIAQERLMSGISLALGLLVALIACIGLHAVMSYEVVQRTHELGVRLALGATRPDVVALVLRESARLTLLGLLVGIPLGVAASQQLRTLLFGIEVDDPATLALVGSLLLLVTTLATLRPARAASRTDPVALLRAD